MDVSDSAMIALVPADPSRLAVRGGLDAADLHCTLVFLGDGVAQWSEDRLEALRRLVQAVAADMSPVEARVFSHSVWNKDKAPNPQGKPTTPCAVYQLRDPGGIARIARSIGREAEKILGVDYPRQWEPYLPHIAAAYDEDDAGKLTTDPGPVRLTTLRLAIGEQTHDYPLTGGMDALASAGGAEMADTTTKPGEPDVTVDKNGTLQLHWPVLVIEGLATGEGGKGRGRFIPYGSLGHRALPLPVAGQVVNDAGHKGAEVFGKITKLVRHEGPDVVSKETGKPFPEGTAVWEAWGEGDATSKPGQLALKGYLTGNSADLTETTVEESLAEDGEGGTVNLKGGKVGGTTLVPIPAFADGFVEVNGQRRDPAEVAVEPMVAAAWTVMDEPEPVVAAGGDPFRPPLSAFQARRYTRATPLTITEHDGHREVHGHICDFSRKHISFTGREVYPPRNNSDYAYFNTGAVTTDTGETVAVGRLTYGGGHADLALDSKATKALYDDAGTAWAWVQATDDAYGIQVNGVIPPDVPDDLVVKGLAHPPSGDWRPEGGRLELVAAHCVNTAGFPIPRALVADGRVTALVAAGALAPDPTSPSVLVEMLRGMVAEQFAELREHLGACGLAPPPARDELEGQRVQVLLDLARLDLMDELGVHVAAEPAVELTGDAAELAGIVAWSADAPGAAELTAELESPDAEALANWVSKTGGLPPYLKRIEKHLVAKGMGESQAIATAVNVAKKMCSTGDTNWPGAQQVNAGSRAEACAAVASWNRQRASA